MSNSKTTGVEGLTLTPAKESILFDLKEGVLTGNEIAAKHNVSPGYVSKLKPKEKKAKIEPQQSKTVTYKKLSPMKSTKMEQDNAEKRKAEKAKELYNSMEAQKKAEGYRWITRAGKHGIKETVFIKQ